MKLSCRLKIGNTQILTLGCPQVGKTSLSMRLAEKTLDCFEATRPSSKIETLPIPIDSRLHRCRVLPGQSSLNRDKGLISSLCGNPSLKGLMYVCSYGHSYQNIECENSKSVDKLLERNRELELEEFAANIPFIKLAKPKFLLIAVNKVDLYWEQLGQARDYYTIGSGSRFDQLISKLVNAIGSDNIQIATQPFFSKNEDLVFGNEVIASQSAASKKRSELVDEFKKVLRELSIQGSEISLA